MVQGKVTRTKDPETGREILTYADGARKWGDTGYWLNGPTDPAHNPVLANPQKMLALRNEKSKQIAREAIDEGAGFDPSQWGTGEGWRKVIVHTVQTYLQSKNIRGMGEVLSKLGHAAGYTSVKDEAEKIPPGRISAAPAEIMALIRLLDEDIKTEIAKAQAIEAEAQ